jgi:hypothetical protein
MSEMSSSAIVEWVNDAVSRGTYAAAYADLKHLPAATAGLLLNGMHGARAPLTSVDFRATHAARARSCAAVLGVARALGFDGALTAADWAGNVDFGALLIFWRWLRAQADASPWPPGTDLTDVMEVPPAPEKSPSRPQCRGRGGDDGDGEGDDDAEGPSQAAADASTASVPEWLAEAAAGGCAVCGYRTDLRVPAAAKRLLDLRKAHHDACKAVAADDVAKLADAVEAAQRAEIGLW